MIMFALIIFNIIIEYYEMLTEFSIFHYISKDNCVFMANLHKVWWDFTCSTSIQGSNEPLPQIDELIELIENGKLCFYARTPSIQSTVS